MKKVIKVIGMLVLVVVLLAIGGITYSTQALPNVEAPADLKVELTEARIERGEYLPTVFVSAWIAIARAIGTPSLRHQLRAPWVWAANGSMRP